MSHYKSDLRDLLFNLFELPGTDQACGRGPFAEFDETTARDVLAEVDRLAREDLAASFADADRNPPTFDPDTHTVTVQSEAFRRSWQAYLDSGFAALGASSEMGGQPCPPSVYEAVRELLIGANPALYLSPIMGLNMNRILWHIATEEQKKVAKL